MRDRNSEETNPPSGRSIDTLALTTLAAAAVAIPLLVSRQGLDAFRIPKLLLLQAEGIVLLSLALTASVLGVGSGIVVRRVPALLALGTTGWTAIAIATSVDPLLSLPSILSVLAGAMIFLWSVRLAARKTMVVIALAGPVAVAIVALVQTNDSWNRATIRALLGGLSEEWIPRLSPISTLGNRNDVGGYLVAPALCAIGIMLTERRGGRRVLAAAVSLVLAAGVFASNTISAIVAFVVASALLAVLRSWKAAAAVCLALVLTAGIAASVSQPFRQRAVNLSERLESGDWDRLLTGRIAPFLAAWEMTKAHPLTGIGPGAFKREYYDYRIAVASRYPHLLPGGGSLEMFEDAHNNHLQIAAETGLVGYALFLACLAVLGRGSLRRPTDDAGPPPSTTAELSRLISLPLALAILVLSLGQCPLLIAATIGSCAMLAGLCVGWRPDVEA